MKENWALALLPLPGKREKQGLNRMRSGKEDLPQGLKPGVFSIVYGPTKVVP